MPTRPQTVALIVDRASLAGDVRAKAMFGGYGLYHEGTLVATVCDDRLFVKPTPAGRGLAPDAAEAPPYPGAKPCLLIDAARWQDGAWLSELFRLTAQALPPPRRRYAARP